MPGGGTRAQSFGKTLYRPCLCYSMADYIGQKTNLDIPGKMHGK